MRATACAGIIMACGALSSGCGTDLNELLEDDNRISWQAYSAVEQAEALDLGLEKPVYEAEAAKDQACEPIYGAAAERFDSPIVTFWQRVWSGLVEFVVWVVPIDSVETCAEAHEQYKEAIVALRERLDALETR